MQNDRTIGELKTARSKRTLRLAPLAIAAIRRSRAERREERFSCGGAAAVEKLENDFVFVSWDNRPWQPNGIQSIWRSIADKAGVGHCRIHDLRHTAASLLIAKGVPITTVAESLGHANTRTTLSTYAHAVKGGQDIAAQAMEELFGADVQPFSPKR